MHLGLVPKIGEGSEKIVHLSSFDKLLISD